MSNKRFETTRMPEQFKLARKKLSPYRRYTAELYETVF